MMSIALWLIGGAKGLASAAFTFLRSLPQLALLSLALALFAGWQTWGKSSAIKARDAVIAHSKLQAAGMVESVRRINAAGARAAKAARDTDARFAQLKKDADNAYDTLATDYRRRADRHARANRVQFVAAATDLSNSGGVPEAPAAPQEPDPAGQNSVVLARDDFDALVENTARLVNAVEWGAGLER